MFEADIGCFRACGGRFSGRRQYHIEEPLEIPGHGDQGPFTGSRVKSSQVKLTKTQHGFDNPEYGLYRALALRIDGAAFHCRQAVVHRLNHIRVRT